MLATLFCLLPVCARAGAWTLPEGKTQVIAGTTISSAFAAFDDKGQASRPVTFHKVLSAGCIEYGWKDWLTVIALPEYAQATSGAPGVPVQRANDWALGLGARARLFDDNGVMSVQLSAKSAGAFDAVNSVNPAVPTDPQTDRQIELRLLYGTNFSLFGRSGYFDAQIAQRFIAGARPSEVPVDLTLGYDIGWGSTAMLQSFNIIAEGDARAPYTYYRLHKVALSVVTPLKGGFSIQSGSFFSPAGQNALAEKGLFVALWASF